MKYFLPYNESLKDFVPYNESLELKKLGFDEDCFGAYGAWGFMSPNDVNILTDEVAQKDLDKKGYNEEDAVCLAPTFSQAFRFFREKHEYFTSPTQYDDDVIKKYDWHITKNLGDGRLLIEFVGYHNTYEEAELACLQKLITLVKNGK